MKRPAIVCFTARDAPQTVVLRNYARGQWDVHLWNTSTDVISRGSRFRGHLWPPGCDLSPDGHWFVYHADAASYDPHWIGVCRPPWLRTIAHWNGDYYGYHCGAFLDDNTLLLNTPHGGTLAAGIEDRFVCSPDDGRLLRVLPVRQLPSDTLRLWRDAWRPAGFRESSEHGLLAHAWQTRFARFDGTRWRMQPSEAHPALEFACVEERFEYSLPGYESVVADVRWAHWDSRGNLLTAQGTAVYRFSLEDLRAGRPGFYCDLA